MRRIPLRARSAKQVRNAEVVEAVLPHLKAEFRGAARMREIGYAGWCEEHPPGEATH